jgi:hypothetical protein
MKVRRWLGSGMSPGTHASAPYLLGGESMAWRDNFLLSFLKFLTQVYSEKTTKQNKEARAIFYSVLWQ